MSENGGSATDPILVLKAFLMTGSTPRHPIQIAAAIRIVILVAGIFFGGATVNAQAAANPFDGRWVIPSDPWFDRLATGSDPGGAGARGAAGRGEQAPGLNSDSAEAIDVAAKHPDRVRAMQALWWEEVARQGVLPLTQGGAGGSGR
jgi:hypothetical protein